MPEKKQITDPDQLIFALKRQRKKKQITQGELGGFANLTIASISRIENSETDPQISTIFRLAKLLNIKIYIEEG